MTSMVYSIDDRLFIIFMKVLHVSFLDDKDMNVQGYHNLLYIIHSYHYELSDKKC